MLITRYGIREWALATIVAGLVIAGSWWAGWWWAAAIAFILWLAVLAFFRDPARTPSAPLAPGSMISPADGKVTAVESIEHHEATGGPAVVIRICLSIFDVHVNRAPAGGEVVAIDYRRGEHLDARRPDSATLNESNLVTIRLDGGSTIGVRQIAGKVARRIVCTLRPGDRIDRGHRFGMIKFGSGTELILPRPEEVELRVRVGDKVCGGRTELARLGAGPEA